MFESVFEAETPLSEEFVPMLGPGFAMIVDYCLALCFFPTRTAYETYQKQNMAAFTGLETVYGAQVDSHLLEGRRDLWKRRWVEHMQDPCINDFAKQPVFPRIGVPGRRLTSHDLEKSLKERMTDSDSDHSAAVSNIKQC